MPTTISAVRGAIVDALETITGLRATALQPEQINPPVAVVFRREWEYDAVMHGDAENSARTYLFGVRTYVTRANERFGQKLLDDLAEPIGAQSVKQILETNSALAAITDWVLVTSVEEVTAVNVGQADFLSQDFNVEVAVS